tara:strand:+ start:17648 stop:18076 length:429 start_codon:yes stop_codon:yes gene_type:complete
MKNFYSIIFTLFFSISLYAQETNNLKPVFKFVTETIDYGKISQGAEGKRKFEFTNTGKSPLIISRVQASCGCTVPKKPEEPIMPGENGEIEVSYDTKRIGGFSKSITIFSNALNERKLIKIKGLVEKVNVLEKKKSILSEKN